MRIATFNLESLDLPPRAELPVEARAEVLRPLLERCRADIVCLQEVNGQHMPQVTGRQLIALDRLLAGTSCAGFHRAATMATNGVGVRDVHNLVTLSRWPIVAQRQLRHTHSQPLAWRPATAVPPRAVAEPVTLDRPLLLVDIKAPDGRLITVANLHLRAPRASSIPGGKTADGNWASASAWAEGYMLSSLKRAQQALELRIEIDRVFDLDAQRCIVVAGDFNAEDHETAIRIAVAAEDDTGNGALAARALIVADRLLSEDRRWSTVHRGRRQMVDHVLVSRPLYARLRDVEVFNEALPDEAAGDRLIDRFPGSYHAPVVATFEL